MHLPIPSAGLPGQRCRNPLRLYPFTAALIIAEAALGFAAFFVPPSGKLLLFAVASLLAMAGLFTLLFEIRRALRAVQRLAGRAGTPHLTGQAQERSRA
jgi:hypothetical protein